MLNYPELINALAADYLNVYVIEPELDKGTIVKLDGYITEGIEDKPKNFVYSKLLETYAKNRVYEADVPSFLSTFSNESLLKEFGKGKDKVEFSYRAVVNSEIKHFTGLYTRLSKPGKPLKVVAGFRGIDDILYAESKKEDEAFHKAYSVISGIYLSMHRVDVKNDTYEIIRSTKAIDSCTTSEHFSENIKSVIDGLAVGESKIRAGIFLNPKTLEERMKNSPHISIAFEGKVAGHCRLHFIKEDCDEDGRLWHALFAVEVLDENKYQSVFDVLAQDYINVFYFNVETGKGRIMKSGLKNAESLPKSEFDYEELLDVYVNKCVVPEERDALKQALGLSHLREVCTTQNTFSGNFQAISNGERHNYSYEFRKMMEVNYLVCGFRCIDNLIAARLKEEQAKLDEQAEHQKVLEEQVAIFNNLSRNFRNVYIADVNKGTVRILKISEDYDYEGIRKYEGKEFPFEEVAKKWIFARVVPSDREYVSRVLSLDAIKKELAKKNDYTGNYRSLENGKVVNYQFLISKIDDSGLVIAGFQVIDKIIEEHLETERRQKAKEEAYQKKLQESYDKLKETQDILKASKMGTWTITLVEGKAPTLEADELMEELLGVKGMNLTPEKLYDAWFDRIEQKSVESVLSSVKAMEEKGFDENTYLWNHPTLGERYVRCGGTAYPVEGGYVLRGYHYDVDYSVRANAEKEKKLAEATALERQHSEVISSIARIYTTIFRANVKTHEYEIINSVPEMYQVAPKKGNFDDVKEKIISTFMAEDFRDDSRSFLDLSTVASRMKNSNTVASEYLDPKGNWFLTRFIEKSHDENGELEEVLYVARSINKEKEQELQAKNALRDALMVAKQASRAKTTFLSNMSHDIRTPMNAIIGFTALARTHINNKQQVEDYLNKIHTSSTHLLSLINEILDMSRIESGTVKLESNPVHVPDVLHDLRTMIQGQVAAKQQNLYIDTLDVVHEDIITDKLRLNQILLNLVSNSIKYTAVGGDISIRVNELPCGKEGFTTYRFSVKDNGIGMSEEFKSIVFDAFSRERSSTISGVQGTGLGMSITKNIVDMMNGTIEVESETGKGSEFIVTIDFPLAESKVTFTPIKRLIGARALVVDDDVYTCQSVSKMLREIQMRPDWSTSGKEAVIRAKEASDLKDEYKVFIIDYMMPDMNGIEAVRQIRKVIGEEIPIIVLTAYDWSDIEEEARRAGVTAFVEKPLFMSELREALSDDEGKNKAEEEEEETNYDFSGKKVLLVEDNDLNREIATALLAELNIEVEIAHDGLEAINIINKADENHFDCVFMDVQMPKMDGYTATKEIRTLPSNAKANLPIIAMTANAFEEDRQKAFESGMNGHIAKPISIKSISDALKGIFAK